MRLAVMHNLWFYNTLMERIREALEPGDLCEAFRRSTAKSWGSGIRCKKQGGPYRRQARRPPVFSYNLIEKTNKNIFDKQRSSLIRYRSETEEEGAGDEAGLDWCGP